MPASSFTSTTSQIGEGEIKTLAFWSRIIVGQVLAGVVVLVTVLLFTGLSLAGGGEHRTLQLLLNKGIITQEEYDQAVQEEERAKVEEEHRAKQANALTKNGLQVTLGGFAEFDFVSDNTQSFQEIIGNRPYCVATQSQGQTASFLPARGAAASRSMCAPQSGMALRATCFSRWIFWESTGNWHLRSV